MYLENKTSVIRKNKQDHMLHAYMSEDTFYTKSFIELFHSMKCYLK